MVAGIGDAHIQIGDAPADANEEAVTGPYITWQVSSCALTISSYAY